MILVIIIDYCSSVDIVLNIILNNNLDIGLNIGLNINLNTNLIMIIFFSLPRLCGNVIVVS